MPIYRIIEAIELGRDGVTIPAGTLDRLATVSARGIERLTQRGAIARVQAPPLAVLPGWKTRADRLTKLDIVMADQFIDADPATIADLFRVDAAQVARWQGEVVAALMPPPSGQPRRG